MAVVARKGSKRTIYWVAFYDDDRKQHWERVGTDKRAAEVLDRKRKREVAEGVYQKTQSKTMPFGEWMAKWMTTRTGRNKKDDERNVRQFLLSREWLCRVPCEQLRKVHSMQLVEELKVTVSPKTGKAISEKYVSNIYGLYSTCAKDAHDKELIPVNPATLPKRVLRRKAKRGARSPYEAADVLSMATCSDAEAMVFAMLAILTGMREGEVCGRRWRDWDRSASPMGSLLVATQYNDQPLKTDKGDDEHPRKVPVMPRLADLLAWWERAGFEFVYLRKPLPSDPIVPRTRDGKTHTRSSGYKLWRKACRLAGVANLSLHSTRHTFVTLARRAGARSDVVESITHNAAGKQIDEYTHWEWDPRCDAVRCLETLLDQNLDQLVDTASFIAPEWWRRRELNRGPNRASSGIIGHSEECGPVENDGGVDEPPSDAASDCARQEVPTRTHRYIADHLHKAKDAALSRNRPGTVRELKKVAAALLGAGGRTP